MDVRSLSRLIPVTNDGTLSYRSVETGSETLRLRLPRRVIASLSASDDRVVRLSISTPCFTYERTHNVTYDDYARYYLGKRRLDEKSRVNGDTILRSLRWYCLDSRDFNPRLGPRIEQGSSTRRDRRFARIAETVEPLPFYTSTSRYDR